MKTAVLFLLLASVLAGMWAGSVVRHRFEPIAQAMEHHA